MKLFFKLGCCLLLSVVLKAQTRPFQLDSLQRELKSSVNDSIRMNLYDQLGWYYAEINRDSSLSYFEMALSVARKLNLKIYEADALNGMGFILSQLGNYPKSLESFLEAQKIARSPETERNTWNLTQNAWNTSRTANPKDARLNLLGWILNDMGILQGITGDTSSEISNLFEARSLAASVRDTTLLEVSNSHLGDAYFRIGKLDSALIFQQNALFLYTHSDVFKKYEGNVLSAIGTIYQNKGDFDPSKDAFLKSVKINEEQKNLSGLAGSYLSLANLYDGSKEPDSSMFYAQKALETFNEVSLPSGISDTYSLLASIFAKRNMPDSAYAYLKLAAVIKDSLNNAERTNLLAFKNKDFDELIRLKKLEEEKIQTQTTIRTFALLAGIGIFILITLLLYRNNKQRQKANKLLQNQKEEIEIQKNNVERTLAELKTTQVQLIQAEKMASLGELTAGIAHEIQNPLNFVNNFSELNKELIEELQEARRTAQGIRDDQMENEILNSIKDNEEKIYHHGKRADAIVKGMLQHSRSGTGTKEPIKINALCDEYLRLSYHGLRAKDKEFNATMKTNFDTTIGEINIVPQEIGRVLMNLYNNAFYAVKKTPNPLVTVTTKKNNNKIEITISDNGAGIPPGIIDKIFQPFFTTKPPGQGTGLGLSLSYDIVKAHGGEMAVKSNEKEGTTFTVILPV